MNSEQSFVRPVALLAVVTGALLLIPFIAMKFTHEVNWTGSDFFVAGFLLFGTGFSYILVTRLLAAGTDTTRLFKVTTGFALFSGLFLIWSNLAVGIIGSENNEFNLIYFAVIAIGLIGAFYVRFRPAGMARVMFAMALAQSSIAVFALFMGMQHLPESSVGKILSVNCFFAVLFTVTGLMYRMDAMNHLSGEPHHP